MKLSKLMNAEELFESPLGEVTGAMADHKIPVISLTLCNELEPILLIAVVKAKPESIGKIASLIDTIVDAERNQNEDAG